MFNIHFKEKIFNLFLNPKKCVFLKLFFLLSFNLHTSCYSSCIERTFIIGLRSNQGDKLANLRQAVKEIENNKKINLVSTSRIYKTKAILLPNTPKEWGVSYFNSAIKIKTSLSPQKLLVFLKKVEHKLQRSTNYPRWSPKTIDLDILYCYNCSINTRDLIVPHPLLLERSFALIPILDIDPLWNHSKCSNNNMQSLIETLESVKILPYPLKGSQLMGVVNLTPISMSGPNKTLEADKLKLEIIKMVNEGAEIIDVGAESTRPNAEVINPEIEWQRLQIFLNNLRDILDNPTLLIKPKISIDTYHIETVKKLKNYNIDIINDVSGSEKDKISIYLKDTNKKYVLVHNLGKAGTKHMDISNRKIITEMIFWFKEQIKELLSLGLKKEQIIIDPGIGFGKNREQASIIIKNINKFHQIGYPILVGHSRKASALPSVANLAPNERDLETAWLSKYFSNNNIDIIRVHNCLINRRIIDEKISLIVAHQTNNGIGIKNQLPWNLEDDKENFRNVTINKTVIMGRKTFESIGKPLKSRRNIVLSKTLKSPIEGIEIYASLQEAFMHIKPKESVFIIGGQKLYEDTVLNADHIFRTLVKSEQLTDTFFPKINENDWTIKTKRMIKKNKLNEYSCSIQTLDRK
ncbi:MAG: dihydropteroate synthase [Janthinobacterium lividum]